MCGAGVADTNIDENLFRYTSGRWLYNESQQMAQRYIEFDVGALHRVIFDVCGSTRCRDGKEGGPLRTSPSHSHVGWRASWLLLG